MAKASRFRPDRFDEVEPEKGYIGLRRVRRRRAFWVLPSAIILVSTAVLVAAGLAWIDRADNYLELDPAEIALPTPEPEPEAEVLPEPEPEPEPVEPIVNPNIDQAADLTVTVLNGTLRSGLAAAAGDRLTREGWPEQTRANAETSTVEKSYVAYRFEDDEGLARGAAQILGIDEVVLSDEFLGARITIVLGSDYSLD